MRALALVVILAAPLTAWLLLRGRNGSAGALLGVVAFAVLAVASPVATAAFVAALLGALLVLRAGAPAVRALAWLLAGVVLIAPFAALMAAQSGAGRFPALASWGDIIARAPAQVVTGFGFDAIAVQGMAGLLPAALPQSILFEIWHELGLVGAAAFAAALWFAMRAVLVLPRLIQAGAAAAYLAAFTLGVLGLASLRAWWLMTIAAGVVLTTAVARGHGRTSRPVAGFIRAAGGEPGASAPKA